jgi:hypothetical protein
MDLRQAQSSQLKGTFCVNDAARALPRRKARASISRAASCGTTSEEWLAAAGISPTPARQREISSSSCAHVGMMVLSTPAVGLGRTSACYTTPLHCTTLAGRSRRRYSSVACPCRSVGLLALSVIEGQDRDWRSGGQWPRSWPHCRASPPATCGSPAATGTVSVAARATVDRDAAPAGSGNPGGGHGPGWPGTTMSPGSQRLLRPLRRDRVRGR